MLLPEIYNAMEAEAIKGMDPAIVAAFQPVQFIRSGFPTHIKELSELPRFADHLTEPETPLYFADGSRFPISGWSNGFTQTEFDLVQPIRKAVRDATAKIGRPVRPMLMPMIHIAPLRALWSLGQHGEFMSVFEVGPGTGYLGPLVERAVLQTVGFLRDYHCTDITQALALWQRFLHEATRLEGRQVWWWNYAQGAAPDADVVYSNANLSEMTPVALKHVISTAAVQMMNSDLGVFMYFHLGDPHHVSAGDVHAIFRAAGFGLRQESPVTIWQLADKKPVGPITLDPIGDGPAIWQAREMAWCLPGEEQADFNPAFVFGG